MLHKTCGRLSPDCFEQLTIFGRQFLQIPLILFGLGSTSCTAVRHSSVWANKAGLLVPDCSPSWASSWTFMLTLLLLNLMQVSSNLSRIKGCFSSIKNTFIEVKMNAGGWRVREKRKIARGNIWSCFHYNRIYATHNTQKILMKQGNLNQFFQM